MNSEFELGNPAEKNDWRAELRMAGEALLVNLPLAVCGAVMLLAVMNDLLG